MINWPREIGKYLKIFFIPCEESSYQPKSLGNKSFFVILAILVSVKLLSVFSFYEFLGADIFNQVSQADLITLTNEARRDNGVSELKQNAALNASAQMKLADMLDNNYFAHESPSGVSPWSWFGKAKYDYSSAGENLAMNFVSSNEVVRAWLNSESHKRNLLYKDFTDVGIAVGSGRINGQNTIVVVQHFGRQNSQTKSVAVSAKPRAIVKTRPAISPKVKLTPSPAPIPKVLAKVGPISLMVAPQGEVRNATTTKQELAPQYRAYYSNKTLNDILIAIVLLVSAMLLLKIFVAIRIQYPRLILRGSLLLIVSLALIYFRDYKFLQGNIIVGNGETNIVKAIIKR